MLTGSYLIAFDISQWRKSYKYLVFCRDKESFAKRHIFIYHGVNVFWLTFMIICKHNFPVLPGLNYNVYGFVKAKLFNLNHDVA